MSKAMKDMQQKIHAHTQATEATFGQLGKDRVLKFKIQHDCNGHFRIVGWWGETHRETYQIVSLWTHYSGIAVLGDTASNKTYIAISAYYEGTLPHEKVILMESVLPTTLEKVDRVSDETGQERVVPYGYHGVVAVRY